MPILLPRRKVLLGLAGTAAVAAIRIEAAQEPGVPGVDPDLVAILNDTHIGAQQKADAPIPRHLMETVQWLLALPLRPALALINGDLALRDGKPEDYRLFAQLIEPLQQAGIPIGLTMGNHDDRQVFYQEMADQKPATTAVQARHVTVIQTARANFFLLDSLKQTMIAEGDLGEAQIHWLAQALDQHPGRPAIIVAHHNPRFGGDPAHYPGGLVDSEALWKVLEPRRQVKAYLHGHIHHWGLSAHQGIHIANTPATSYVADIKKSTTGWTMAKLGDRGLSLTTHTHVPEHPWNRQTHELAWRNE